MWGGARGWNADQFGRQLLLLLVRRSFGGVWIGVVVGGWFVGTLLGPERAGSLVRRGGLLAHVRACLISYHRTLVGCPGLAGLCGGCLVVR